MESYDFSRIHDQIIEETFETLSLDEAVSLVGILQQYTILYSKRLRDLCHRVERLSVMETRPLPPEVAAAAVARVFRFDYATLLQKFRGTWAQAKDSETVERLKDRIRSHRFVRDFFEIGDPP